MGADRHIQYRQFFHVSPEENRESIELHGLDHSLGEPQWNETVEMHPGNYLFHDVKDARIHARNMSSAGEEGTPNYLGNSDRFDLYEVSVPEHRVSQVVKDDPLLEDASYTDDPIPRGWIRRRESAGPWGEEH